MPTGPAERLELAHESLRASEERFRLLVESVVDYAIFVLDPQGFVLSWNAGAERMKGYLANEIVGKHFSTFYPREDVASGKCERILQEALRAGRVEDEGHRVRKDGTTFWANVVITALYDKKTGLVGFAKVTRDLTERVRAEEARLHLVEAQEASRLKDDFLATISHELRTPLHAILGWSTILANHANDPEVARAAATIRRNAQEQTRIVEDVLDMSRIVAGQLQLESKTVDLLPIVHVCLDVMHSAAKAKRITLTIEHLAEELLVRGDATRLHQVVWNLVANAVKFSDAGASVKVSAVQEGDHAVIAVSDTGRGMAPEFLLHTFERFRQADSSTTRRFGGLGLGLALVRHVVELHGGHVKAESPGLGLGSTFTISLPLDDTNADTNPMTRDGQVAPPQMQERAPLLGAKLLVVEDEFDTRELLQIVLQDAGAHVETAASANEARQSMVRSVPDAIVSDIGMPGEDGYAFLQSVRALPVERGGAVPAIAVTAYASPEDRKRARSAGFDEHVAKPVDPSDLVRVVRVLLTKSR